MMADLIDRQQAIDACMKYNGYGTVWACIMGDIKLLPSAQSEERTEERTETHACDLISRQAVLHELDWCDYELKDWQRCKLKTMVKDIPSAQPEPQWIPVSERVPEEYGNYLISIHGEDEPDIGTINTHDKRGWSLCDANGFHWASDKKLIVTAWMPLPEPYRAERRTDEK